MPLPPFFPFYPTNSTAAPYKVSLLACSSPPTPPLSLQLRQFYCPEGQYNDMATIFFNSQEDAIKNLMHQVRLLRCGGGGDVAIVTGKIEGWPGGDCRGKDEGWWWIRCGHADDRETRGD